MRHALVPANLSRPDPQAASRGLLRPAGLAGGGSPTDPPTSSRGLHRPPQGLPKRTLPRHKTLPPGGRSGIECL